MHDALQPLLHTGTVSITYGYSLYYIRLQVDLEAALVPGDARRVGDDDGERIRGRAKEVGALVRVGARGRGWG